MAVSTDKIDKQTTHFRQVTLQLQPNQDVLSFYIILSFQETTAKGHTFFQAQQGGSRIVFFFFFKPVLIPTSQIIFQISETELNLIGGYETLHSTGLLFITPGFLYVRGSNVGASTSPAGMFHGHYITNQRDQGGLVHYSTA